MEKIKFAFSMVCMALTFLGVGVYLISLLALLNYQHWLIHEPAMLDFAQQGWYLGLLVAIAFSIPTAILLYKSL